MREINLDGYIDDEVFWGDEITPDMLREALYGTSGGEPTDVRITLNSYGGSCNAATRMHDMLRDYPAKVHITISGTAASAATVLAMAADTLEMTPGSLYMIHDPSTVAWGDEQALMDAMNLLRACKESILNVYQTRCKGTREELAAMMTATTWMDAQTALNHGFIDRITERQTPSGAVTDAVCAPITNQKEAEQRVRAYFERRCARAIPDDEKSGPIEPAPEPKRADVPIEQLEKRLNLIKS